MSAEPGGDPRVGNLDLLLECVTRALLAIVQGIDAYRGIVRPRFVDKHAQRR